MRAKWETSAKTSRLLWWPFVPWFALALLLATAAAGREHPAGTVRSEPEVLWHEARALFPLRVHLPKNFDAARTYPAVIAFHGFGSSSERFERIGRAFADAGFITVLPEGPYPVSTDEPGRHSTWELSTWTEEFGLGPPLTTDPAVEARSISLTVDGYFPVVFERIREQYRVGPVYLCGFSLGGVYALVGGFHNRDDIDGIIAFGAQFYPELFTTRGDRLEDGNHLRIRVALGRSDPLVPFSHAERARDAFEEAGYEVTLDGFEGGHAVPDDALNRAVSWLRDLTGREVVPQTERASEEVPSRR